MNSLWYKDAILYEVHVKSFFDSNGDGVGDLAGLARKLDYIQELGITCLWLQPFYPSPLRDDGYDIADFRGVHAAYGTVEDFRRLVDGAHSRGIRVVTELVLSHTSDQHPWFQAARRAPAGSSLRNYYVWRDLVPGDPIVLTRHDPSGWTWDPVAQASYRHHFSLHQPDLNYEHALVRQEMLRVMTFWLDQGADGLCVEALPFSAESEGANLHAVLKEARAEVERAYPDRILVASVNSGPADVRPFFGEGDECHLALHFALMPRLVMALNQEDGEPVTEAVRQTPATPHDCQWALFLRNHDELSLRLVSDEERDDLYRAYASDPQMRHNFGICRRLAPLLDNSQSRIELLHALLFSLPGTPVLYYGDEIGMGDNVYLGDRLGVRTPMQWTGERNAGFSQADFARLVTPPIVDPVYGYPAVNVEAQRRDPSSLLNALRHLLAVRRRLPALARGDFEFVRSSNHKVLAFVRRLGEDVCLVVANLSRHVQPVELDLSAFAEFIPVDAFGGTEFPRIGRSPYVLTPGPHAFCWLPLRQSVENIAVRFVEVRTEEFKDVPLVTITGQWENFLSDPVQEALNEVLPRYLQGQRWFGGKARQVSAAHIVDWAVLPSASAVVLLTLVEVAYPDGASDLYSLPLEVVTGPRAAGLVSFLPGRILARLTSLEGDGLLIDALADTPACAALLAAIAGGREFASRCGRIRAVSTEAFPTLRGAGPLKARPGPATSSNTLVFYGRRLLLKMFRRLDAGINPDLEVGRFLTEKAKFAAIPQVAGFIEYQRRGAEPATLAVLEQLVASQGDGWQHAVDELQRYYERASPRLRGPEPDDGAGRSWFDLAERDPSPGVLEVIGNYLQSAVTLGRRTAEMHLALASDASDLAFTPEPLCNGDVARLAAEARAQVAKALQLLRDNLDRLPPTIGAQGREILDQQRALLNRLLKLPETPLDAAKIRCHGDYHLGQVLRVENDFIILDFEGEPVHSIAQRRVKQSPLKDVAAMLRSFGYAAYAGLFAFTHRRTEAPEQFLPWAELWQRWTSAVFLREYRATASGATFLPADPGRFTRLLEFFTVGKALYELIYELNNRPDWVRIPLQGILAWRDAVA
jgi:maltose alpha-D-glucosyltransferase/alpha-amylase